jgi:hypothetical protein
VPSTLAIAIPSAALSPPRVSRPVSFGRFMTASTAADQHPRQDAHRRSWGSDAGAQTLDEVLSLERTESDPASEHAAAPPGILRYPSGGTERAERVAWARFDTLPGARPRCVPLALYNGKLSHF